MPLMKSASANVIGPNIKREEAAGKPYRQALAIALHTQDTARRQHQAGGGLSLSSPPYYERGAIRSMQEDTFHPAGLFKSDVAGRTDRLPRSVPADSFVMPADVVSGLGQNNTAAGAKILDGILSSGPYGTPLPRSRRATGGTADGADSGLSHVMVAGGEYLISRNQLVNIGAKMRHAGKSRARSDLAAGHEWARGMVDKVRKMQMDFLKHAPKPKK